MSVKTAADKRLQFEISDSGIGIPENEQNNIFQKFFRAKNAIEQKNAGSGLSLFIAKKIVEGFSGTIWFESSPRGSKFAFVC